MTAQGSAGSESDAEPSIVGETCADVGSWAEETFLARLAGEHAPDLLVVADPDGVIRFVGRSSERVLGLSAGAAAGTPLQDFVHPDDLDAASGALSDAMRVEGYHHPSEFRVRHTDGGWVDCEVSSSSIDGPGGLWLVLAVRAARERDEVIGRRRRIEQLIRAASLECSAVRWNEVGQAVQRVMRELADIVGAELVELARQESGDELTLVARWPALPTGAAEDIGGPFRPLWALGEGSVDMVNFSSDPPALPNSSERDRFVRLGVRAVVEVPLTDRAPWSLARLAFGQDWNQWDDVNADLVRLLMATLMATLRRCEAEAHLHEQARSDPLTGLMNRAELYRRFESLLSARAQGSSRAGDAGSVGVLYGDLDRFKEVNDRHGHAAGDRLLVEVADALRSSVREVDMVARFGGDEFVIVCPELDSPESLSQVVARVSRAVGALRSGDMPIRMSVGAAVAVAGLGADDLVRLADEAMYRAKRSRGVPGPV
jgi:diguanylate cyclase (GGDEF)-like protein/PAS domain S-box-containing protein